MNEFILVAWPASTMLTFLMGIWMQKRGLTGIKSDFQDIKTDLENLRKHNEPLPQPVA